MLATRRAAGQLLADPFDTMTMPWSHAVRTAAARCAALVLLLLPATSAHGQSQGVARPLLARALRVEDFYALRSVGAPAISPDGRWVAFAVTSRVEATNAEPSEVWLVPSDASRPAQRVSPEGRNATQPRWTDDGKLQFVADNKGWQLDPTAPTQLTEVERPAARRPGGELTIPAPNGSLVAYVRNAPPPPRAPAALTDFEQRHEARFKGRQFDWLDFQRDGQDYPAPSRIDPYVTPAQELWISRNGAEAQQLTRLALRPQGVQWNRDATRLLFVADSSYREERRYGASAVYTVALDGSVRRLTPDRDYQHTNAAFSPDGKWVLYTKQLSADAVIARKLDHGGATDLYVVPADGGAERNLTAEWDYLPSDAQWSPDGRNVYFMGGVGGTTHLFRVAAAGGPVEQVTKGERRINNLDIDERFTTITYTVGLIDAPADVYVANIDGSKERRLTTLNADALREVSLSRAVRLQFPSKDGTPIEGWLLTPFGTHAAGGPYPLVVMNHGGPHSADGYAFDFKAQYMAANGYFVLKVNFRSSTGYGEKFLWATWGGWGNKDGEDVMAGIDYAIAHYPIDRSKVATMGHSYGGFMTNWLITQYPDRFAAAIPGAGIVNWVSDYGTADIARTKETEFYGTPWDPKAREIMIRQSPLTYADRVKAPTLFVHGANDERVPYSEAEQMYVALKKNGVPTKMIQYEGQWHSIGGSWNSVHRMLNERRWLDQWLKGAGVS
ncbi:MAG: S9 family peptidase [Gemmatimonadaceae bacterium]